MKFRLVEEQQSIDPNAEKALDKMEETMPEDEFAEIDELLDIINTKKVIENPNIVTRALDRSLEIALDAYEDGEIAGKDANVIFVGRAGTGKTSIVKQWANHRHVNLVMKDAKSFDKSDIGGGVAAKVDSEGRRTNQMTHLSNDEFDSLMKPGSVLFLDELNRADPEVVGSLLTLILDHTIPDSQSPDGMKFLKGLLFVVAAINPATEAYDGANTLDAATLDRFTIEEMGDVDTVQYRKYLLGVLKEKIKEAERKYKIRPDERHERKLTQAQGRYKLADTLLSSPYFTWDTMEEEIEAHEKQQHTLSPRGFEAVINRCNGTKDDLLKVWGHVVNPDKLDMAEQILTDYEDVDDKANDALRYKNGFLDDKKTEDEDEGSIFDSGNSKNVYNDIESSGLFDD